MAENAQKGKIVVVSGPSGVGKSTICRELARRLDAYLSISATTRTKSDQETDGADYWFISRDEFLSRIAKNDFLEYAEVFGNLYGTPKDKIDQALACGKPVILEIDVQGGRQVREIYPDAILICILPPNIEELITRISSRARDSVIAAKRRLESAQREIADAKKFYKYMVVNDELEKAITDLVEIIKKEEITK